MATSNEKYTEGGMPSNRQVVGIRTADLVSTQLEDGAVVLGDTYNLFDLSADEVILSMGVDNRSAAAASTVVEINIDATAVTGLSAVDLTAVAKDEATTLPAAGATGVVNAIVTGGLGGGLDIDFSVWAVVANVKSLVTQTAVDTPAP